VAAIRSWSGGDEEHVLRAEEFFEGGVNPVEAVSHSLDRS
jgi:hypothetical protein